MKIFDKRFDKVELLKKKLARFDKVGTKECAIRSHTESLGWSGRDMEDLEDIKVITYGPCGSNQTNHTSIMFECVNTTGCNLIKLIIPEYISV